MILVFTVIITLLYCALIISFVIGFDLVKSFHSKNKSVKNSFSIIIPFRNESVELPNLLESIEQLDYSKKHYEIIFVDDDSDDDSVALIKQVLDTKSVKTDFTRTDIKIINNNRNTNSAKKDAINTAIRQAKFDWIITTDADCVLPKNWLQSFDAFIQEKKPKMIVAPVTYNSKNTFIERFQHLDFLSLIGSTIGGFGINKPFLCNGANLCYHKQTFFDVNGFEGNSTIASGDDIFLLEKLAAKYPQDIYYLKSKDAIITTKPQLTFKKLLDQRVRWAAKSTAYTNIFSKLVSISVLAMNILLIILITISLLNYVSWQFLVLIFGIKFSIDLLLIYKTASFFKQQKVLLHYILSSFIYPVFIMFVVIASLTSGYSWKGREFRK